MQSSEKFRPLAGYESRSVKLLLPVESHQHTFEVNPKSLKRLARYFGFSEVKILPVEHMPHRPEKTAEVHSITRDTSNDPHDILPLKAKWQAINLYLDITTIKRNLPQGYTDKQLARKLENLIKGELEAQGTKFLKQWDPTLLEIDVVGATIIYFVALSAELASGHQVNRDVLQHIMIISVIAKIVLTNLDSLSRYQLTDHGARFALLEGTQAEKLLIKGTVLQNNRLVHLRNKPSTLR